MFAFGLRIIQLFPMGFDGLNIFQCHDIGFDKATSDTREMLKGHGFPFEFRHRDVAFLFAKIDVSSPAFGAFASVHQAVNQGRMSDNI